jgi:RES domain
VIKHERRFFFSKHQQGRGDDEIFSNVIFSSPEHILEIIFDYAETIGLIRKLSRGTRLYRVRKLIGKSRTTLCLGPPPPEKARQQNRMSPAGISMLYASEDSETALRETIDKPDCTRWRNSRPNAMPSLSILHSSPEHQACLSQLGTRWNTILGNS